MQMGFEEEGVGARASDREIGLGFGGGYGKITGSTSHPRIHVTYLQMPRISVCDRKAGTVLRYDRDSDSVTILGEPGDREFIFDILDQLDIEPDLLLGY